MEKTFTIRKYIMNQRTQIAGDYILTNKSLLTVANNDNSVITYSVSFLHLNGIQVEITPQDFTLSPGQTQEVQVMITTEPGQSANIRYALQPP